MSASTIFCRISTGPRSWDRGKLATDSSGSSSTPSICRSARKSQPMTSFMGTAMPSWMRIRAPGRALARARGPGAVRRCRPRFSRLGVLLQSGAHPRPARWGRLEPQLRLDGSADRRTLSPRSRQRLRADRLWGCRRLWRRSPYRLAGPRHGRLYPQPILEPAPRLSQPQFQYYRKPRHVWFRCPPAGAVPCRHLPFLTRRSRIRKMYAGSFADMTRAAFYRATMWYRAAIVASSLACGLLSDLNAQAIKAAELPPAQREAIEGIIHDYVLKNPDVLIEALQNAQDKLNHEADSKATKVLSERASEIFDDPATPVGGNPKGNVNIVEFFDYRCPYCKQVVPALQSLLKEDHELRFVYMEFPVLGPASVVAARAALAARQQGKYEAFHTAMMATKGQITEDTVYEVADSVGIDVDRLKQDMNAPEIDQALKENSGLAQALNIHAHLGLLSARRSFPGLST